MNSLLKLVVAGACPLLLANCFYAATAFNGTHRAYRTNASYGAADSTVQHLKDGAEGSPATLAFLEFDDQGEPWRSPNPKEGWQKDSRTQLSTVLAELEKQRRKGPLKTVIFIHGWNNNAKPGNPNLANFEHSLKELAAVSKSPVFGVFVAWRGTIANFPIGVDVASREATAGRIGGPSLLASLRAISTATHRDEKGSVTAIGHSFGAKILTQVTCNHLAAQIGAKIGEEKSKIQPLADTVILANTAENGALPLQLMNLMRDYKLNYESPNGGHRDLPLVVSICSLKDSATGNLLPIWNNISRKYLGFPHKGGATSNRIQDGALFNAMGFYGPLRSHTILHDGEPVKDRRVSWKPDQHWGQLLRENVKLGAKWPLPEKNDAFQVALSSTGDANVFEAYTVTRLTPEDFTRYSDEAQPNETPFWFLQVPSFVSSGHGDLWNPNFTGLVAAIESMRSPSATARKQGILAPAPKAELNLVPVR